MLSSNTRRHPHLPPIMIPAPMPRHFSSYPSPCARGISSSLPELSSSPSPIESDIIQTPASERTTFGHSSMYREIAAWDEDLLYDSSRDRLGFSPEFAQALPTLQLPQDIPSTKRYYRECAPPPSWVNPSSSRVKTKTLSSMVAVRPITLPRVDLPPARPPRTTHTPIFDRNAHLHSPRFPPRHKLCPYFVNTYQLADELGSGGFAFVMTARHRADGYDVAVKFIEKSKVPPGSWRDDGPGGRMPIEVTLLRALNHPNIIKCLDVFEDSLYIYMIQELHGSPWTQRAEQTPSGPPGPLVLHPGASQSTKDQFRFPTPPKACVFAKGSLHRRQDAISRSFNSRFPLPRDREAADRSPPEYRDLDLDAPPRPMYTRRPSHDLYECLEQSKCRRLFEPEARYVFAQVVEAVYYLHSLGIAHRDIKDENLLIDVNYKVKMIDFGSVVYDDPSQPHQLYTGFFGTTAYASPEILQKIPYEAHPAEIWTLGVLLSFLLTGCSPFPSPAYTIVGKIYWPGGLAAVIPEAAMDLMKRCLDVNPKTRATIEEVRMHDWLKPCYQEV